MHILVRSSEAAPIGIRWGSAT